MSPTVDSSRDTEAQAEVLERSMKPSKPSRSGGGGSRIGSWHHRGAGGSYMRQFEKEEGGTKGHK